MCVSSVFVLLYDVLCASSSPPPLSSPPWGTSGFPQGTRFNAHGVQEVHCVQSSHIRPCLFSHFTADWFFPFVRPPPPHPPTPFSSFSRLQGGNATPRARRQIEGGRARPPPVDRTTGRYCDNSIHNPYLPPCPPPQLPPPIPPPLLPLCPPSTPPLPPPLLPPLHNRKVFRLVWRSGRTRGKWWRRCSKSTSSSNENSTINCNMSNVNQDAWWRRCSKRTSSSNENSTIIIAIVM